MLVYLGSFYILIGAVFLLIPLTYLELGKPRDLLKAFLNLIVGFVLIIKNKTIDELTFVILLLLTSLVVFYVVEIFLSRWIQLTDKEKNKLTTLSELKKNLSKVLEAINLVLGDFTKPFYFFSHERNNQKLSSKKWVRNDKNDNIKI